MKPVKNMFVFTLKTLTMKNTKAIFQTIVFFFFIAILFL